MIRSMTVALAAMTLTLLYPSPAAAQADMPTSQSPEVRVVNNHHYRVRVVLVDETGRHHPLGRVAPSKAEIFNPDPELLAARAVRIKVFADEPVWSAGNTGEAIRSRDLTPNAGTSIYVWVEPDLTRSQITVGR